MAIKITEQPTSVIIYYQQMIDLANQEMRQMVQHARQLSEQGKLPPSYFQELDANLGNRYEKNSEIIDKLEKELNRRIKKSFPEATTSEMMKVFYKTLQEKENEYSKKEPAKAEDKNKGTFKLKVPKQKEK